MHELIHTYCVEDFVPHIIRERKIVVFEHMAAHDENKMLLKSAFICFRRSFPQNILNTLEPTVFQSDTENLIVKASG